MAERQGRTEPSATRGWVGLGIRSAQMLFSVVVMVVVVAAFIADPAPFDSPLFLTALGLVFLITVLAAGLPWGSFDKRWGITIPLLDIIAIWGMREAVPELGMGLLLVFPMAFVASTFGLIVNVVILGVTLAGVWLPHLLGIELSQEEHALDFQAAVQLPILLIFVTSAAFLTARRRREQSDLVETSLRKANNQEQTLDEMLNAVDFGVIGFDRDGEFTFVNKAQRQGLASFGFPDDAVVYPVVYQADRLTPQEHEARPLIRALAGQTFDKEVIWVGEPGGRQAALSTSARALHDRAGEYDGGILVLHDVTTEIEAELATVRELDRAAEVQRALLPKTVPPLEGYEVAGACVPAKFVGGDFFDWYAIEGGMAITLADVMGKGVGAGIIAATVRATIRSARRDDEVVVAVGRVAEALAEDLSQAESFVTLFHARLRAADGCVSFVDAGHGLTIVVGPDGAAERLSTTDLPLGTTFGSEWNAQEVFLERGGTLVSFSDGVLDLYDGSLATVERVAEIVRGSASASEVVNEIERLARREAAPDDVTVVAIRRSS